MERGDPVELLSSCWEDWVGGGVSSVRELGELVPIPPCPDSVLVVGSVSEPLLEDVYVSRL